MQARIQVSEKLKKFLRSKGVASKEVQLAFRKALRVIQEYARNHHDFRPGPGNFLEKSIDSRLLSEHPLKGEVFVGDLAPYGIYVHEGTRAHVIFNKRKKSLRWSCNNKFYFAKRVNHPGTWPDPFLTNAVAVTSEETVSMIENAITEDMGGAD
jgi:hypothetical protein